MVISVHCIDLQLKDFDGFCHSMKKAVLSGAAVQANSCRLFVQDYETVDAQIPLKFKEN